MLRRKVSVTDDSGANAPTEVWYRFGGKEMGYVGNNGTDNVSAAKAADRRRPSKGTGIFRRGSQSGTPTADFDQNYTALNSFQPGSAAGGYTVRGGDTLQGIASGLYGDSSLWYKIAQANGISGDTPLIEGTTLRLPAGVTRTTYNASTFKPYDPGAAVGDTAPTAPEPPKDQKCGVMGQILVAVVTVAVTVATGGNAVAGNLAGQAFGLATGIQDKFSWKSLAMAYVTQGVAAGVNQAVGAATNTLGAIARGAASSVISQGIGDVVGLQKRINWTGVAAAGIGAGVSFKVGQALGVTTGQQDGKTIFGGARYAAGAADPTTRFIQSSASALANAATRSAMDGTSFGDNLIEALPDVIGNAVGGAIGANFGGEGKIGIFDAESDFGKALGHFNNATSAAYAAGKVGNVLDAAYSAIKQDLANPVESNRKGRLLFNHKQLAHALPESMTDAAPFEISSGGLRIVEPANDNRPPRGNGALLGLLKKFGVHKAASFLKSGWGKDTITVAGGNLAGELDITIYNGQRRQYRIEQFVDGESVYREDFNSGLSISRGDQIVIGLQLPDDSPLTYGVGNLITFTGNQVGTDVSRFFVDSSLEAYGIASAISYGESAATSQQTITTLINNPSSFDERSPAHRKIALTAFELARSKGKGKGDDGINSVRVQLQGLKVKGGQKDSTGGRLHSNRIFAPETVSGLVAHGQLIALHEQAYKSNIKRGQNGPEILLRLGQAHDFIRKVSGTGITGTESYSFPNNQTPKGVALGKQLRVDVELFDNTKLGNLK